MHRLYSKIHRFLRNDAEGTGISDDMDIVLCTLDLRTNALSYSGVKNSLYRISKGELIDYPAQNSTNDNCEDGDCQFISTEIQLEISISIYICMDGFSDQFHGEKHKRYQSARLQRAYLRKSYIKYPSVKQSDRLYQEMRHWRDENNEDQTDDILIIGIRI